MLSDIIIDNTIMASNITPVTNIDKLDTSLPSSTKDNQLNSCLLLKDIACRQEDAYREILRLYDVFAASEHQTREQKRVLTSLKHSIIPYLKSSSIQIMEASSKLAPIPGSSYVHIRNEAEKRRLERNELPSNRDIKPSPLKRIDLFNAHRVPLKQIDNLPRPQKKVRHQPKRKSLPSIASSIPEPANKRQYTPKEVCTILSPFPENSKVRSKLIQDWMSTSLIPISKVGIYKLLQRYREGKKIEDNWNRKGRKRLLDEDDIKEINDVLNKRSGLTIEKEEIVEKIKSSRNKRVTDDGLVPITKQDITVSNKSIINYRAMLAVSSGISISTTSVTKTNTRYTAENSLISAMALLGVVAATHYFICDEGQLEIKTEMRDAPDGVELLYKLVSDVYGNLPIFAVKPELLFSTDDTVNYIYEGKGETKDVFRLVASKALKKAGTRSKYKTGNSKNMCGMRVKLTYTFSAAGTMAPFFITVCGLSEREMPTDSCIVLKIQGLCVGGSGVSVGPQQYGYLCFMRGDGKMDKNRYKNYRDKVFLPFVEATRSDYADLEKGTVIPADLQAVSWCDGDLAQIDNVVNEESLALYAEHKICACKQNAARSGTEQAADLAKTFKIMQNLQQTVTVSNVPIERHPLKRLLCKKFDSLMSEGRLRLKPRNKAALIDFIGSIPQMSAQACTIKNINHGFRENGMSDGKYYRYPDFNKLLATCRLDPTVEEYELCKLKFSHLLKLYLKDGHVDDKVFEALGFPMDRDVAGEKVRRDASINMEARQRAKILTHQHQVELREERILTLQAEVKRKDDDKREKIVSKLDDNEACERKMCTLMKKEYDLSHLKDVTHAIINKCTSPLLQAFILVRKLDLLVSKLGNKEKLVTQVYEYRTLPNLLQSVLDDMNSTSDSLEEVVEEQENETNEEVLRLGVESEVMKASTFLLNNEWVHKVKTLLNSDNKITCNDVTEELTRRADTLQKTLLFRFTYHVKRRIEDKSKHNHWVMRWSRRNMAQVAGIMTLFNHVKKDLECMQDISSTLLGGKNQFVKVEEKESNLQGAYLYYDTNDGKWIRSGKVTRRSFGVRHAEHVKKSESKRTTSTLYSRYPSKNNEHRTSRKGFFDNLEQCVAVGFSLNKIIEEAVAKRYDEGGIFDSTWDEEENIKRNQRCNFIDMIAYQIELGYDLAISPSDNVSNSPGFESFIGVW